MAGKSQEGPMRRVLMVAVSVVALVGGQAFAQESKQVKEAPKKAEGTKLDDAQIATVALTAHDLDATRGKWAMGKTKSDDVKQFAKQMFDDHTAGKKEVLDLAKKLNVTPK